MPEQLPVEARKLAILDELERGERVSQRELAERAGVSLGLINRCIRELIDAGYITVLDPAVRPFAYVVTDDGKRYRQGLTYNHYRSVVGSFLDVERRIRNRLTALKQSGARRVVFYGAGDVMEVAYLWAEALGFEVVGAVDDDPSRQGQVRATLQIDEPIQIAALKPDAIVITTFRHAEDIECRLRDLGADASSAWHL